MPGQSIGTGGISPPPPLPGQSMGAGGIPPPPLVRGLKLIVKRNQLNVVSPIKTKQLLWERLGKKEIDQNIWENSQKNNKKHVDILKEKGIFEKSEQ